MRLSAAGFSPQPPEGERRVLNSELWHACAGPLVSLPAVGTRVVYFPQGHSEQVTKLLHDINLFCLLSSGDSYDISSGL
ncbi:Auxin response factor 6, partial [Cucurbita argyrosperma subsp. sororia]